MIAQYLYRSFNDLLLTFLILLPGGGFDRLIYAAPPAQNPYPECPSNANSIWVRVDTYSFDSEETVQIPFESGEIVYEGNIYVNYLLGVLLTEIGPKADFNPVDDSTMRAMAILARTVAYRNCGCEIIPDNANCARSNLVDRQGFFHRGLNDSAKQQYNPKRRNDFTSADRERYQQAIDDTAGMYLTYEGRVFDVQYRPISDLWTGTLGGLPHLGIYDPAGLHHQGQGNQPGFPQINANHYATGHNHDGRLPPYEPEQLVGHYISGVEFAGFDPTPPTDYRLNILYFGNQDDRRDDPLILRAGQSYVFGFIVQNTGDNAWDLSCYPSHPWHETALSFHWYSYPARQYLAPRIPYFETRRTRLCGPSLAPGQTYPAQSSGLTTADAEVLVQVPPGEYWLRLDVEFRHIVWGSRLDPNANPNEARWPTQDIRVRVIPDVPLAPIPNISSGQRPGRWSNDNTVTLTWAAVNDPFLAHYRVCRDRRDDGQGADCRDVSGANYSTTLADGIYDFEVTAVTKDDKRSRSAALDNIRIDATPPTAQLVSLPERVQAPTYRLIWLSADSGGSGLAETKLEYRIWRDGQVIADWRRVTAANNPATDQLLFDFPGGQQGDRYEFCLHVRDGAGSWSDAACDSTLFKPEPELYVHPTRIFRFRVYTDTVPSVETLRIENHGGGGALDWTATTPFTLASLSPARGQTPAAVTVTLTHPPGITATYTGTITVSAEPPGVHNNPQRVQMTVWVVEKIYTGYFPVIFKQ